MALDPNKVISPNLQEFFIDPRTNLPASGGTVTYYEENGITLKAIYTLSGSPGSYSYVQLPNPLTLSGAGTTVDESGNDVRVYYYPYNPDTNQVQNYYITAQAADGYEILVRRAWPNEQAESATVTYFYNFVRNHTFFAWGDITSFSDVKLGSTDQYDFFPNDWTYWNNDATKTINITQQAFAAGTDPIGENQPYYLELEIKSSGGSQTVNAFRQFYQSAQTLSGKNVVCDVYVRQQTADGGQFSVSAIQSFGSGSSTPDVTTTIIEAQPVLMADGWQKLTGTVQLPSISSADLKTDSTLILSLNCPIAACKFNIGAVHFREGTASVNDQELSNDEIAQNTNVIALYPPFSTGDVKMTLKAAADAGWLMMDDGTIGATGSGATSTGWKYYPLYDMIWTNVADVRWAPIYTSAGAVSTYGASAEADWAAGKRLSLPRQLGRVMAGVQPSSHPLVSMPFVASSSSGLLLTVDNTLSFFTGTVVQVVSGSMGIAGVLPTGLSVSTNYYCIPVSSTTLKLATSQAYALAGTAISYTDAGTAPNTIFTVNVAHPLGEYLGEETHAQTNSELSTHTHIADALTITADGVTDNTIGSGGGGARGSVTPTIQNTGSNTPFNIIQPVTYWNVMIKL